jgi:hypothetical protein
VLAGHARDHILRWGDESPFVQKYFGSNHSTAEPLGRYERIVAGDKTGMTFRCDDPDLNCATQEGKLLPHPCNEQHLLILTTW